MGEGTVEVRYRCSAAKPASGTDGILLGLSRSRPSSAACCVQDLIEQFYKTKKPIVLPVYEDAAAIRSSFPLLCMMNSNRFTRNRRAAVVWRHGKVEEVQRRRGLRC